ncbi:MAG: GNAT family N-acetyltransferase [Calditrichaeota bacterium]|nr:GNAT family N-acetyltransferase [Candidatus Cloacimonadota bacterium]MCB1046551.1 GNAT family N-acetyltransferase [Calditrichota bacterium]MCB9474929.1 GNAT family N-acetyltransferase [Candidatus Delongbacteria bacterium]
MSDTVFETERLRVRRWRDSDLEPLLAVYGDPEAMKWVDDGKPIAHDECVRWLGVTRANYEARGYGMFAVEEKGALGVIGFCGLVHPGGQPEPEVKYAYRRSHWGRGIATEVVVGLIRFCAREFGIRHLIATTAPENTASHRVLLKAGLTQGLQRQEDDGTLTQIFDWRSAEGQG